MNRVTSSAAAFSFLLLSVLPAHAQTTSILQSEQILSPAGDVVEHDSFGSAVAISGNTMVIGGVNADGNEVGAGAAFIFDRIGNDWVQTARLFAADGKAEPVPGLPGKFRSDSCGSTVAISGDPVVAGAPGHAHPGKAANSGAVYVFQRVEARGFNRRSCFLQRPTARTSLEPAMVSGALESAATPSSSPTTAASRNFRARLTCLRVPTASGRCRTS